MIYPKTRHAAAHWCQDEQTRFVQLQSAPRASIYCEHALWKEVHQAGITRMTHGERRLIPKLFQHWLPSNHLFMATEQPLSHLMGTNRWWRHALPFFTASMQHEKNVMEPLTPRIEWWSMSTEPGQKAPLWCVFSVYHSRSEPCVPSPWSLRWYCRSLSCHHFLEMAFSFLEGDTVIDLIKSALLNSSLPEFSICTLASHVQERHLYRRVWRYHSMSDFLSSFYALLEASLLEVSLMYSRLHLLSPFRPSEDPPFPVQAPSATPWVPVPWILFELSSSLKPCLSYDASWGSKLMSVWKNSSSNWTKSSCSTRNHAQSLPCTSILSFRIT